MGGPTKGIPSGGIPSCYKKEVYLVGQLNNIYQKITMIKLIVNIW